MGACSDAVGALDGRELFTYDSGKLIHSASKLCASVGTGARIVLEVCGERAGASFELQGNGQLRLSGNGSCVSLAGAAAGAADVALFAATAATSTAASSHAAAMSVDGRST